MQGLGKNAGANTLFYGSVHDSTTHRTLETKLKKAYWETKQTFIQKLGKDQDEHVVASDSDIDLRLEQSRRVEASCHGLSTCIKKYQVTVSELVSKHNNLGYYLDNISHKEVTNVSKVMKDVGNIEKTTASSWSKVSPVLRQLSHDLDVFISRGLRDLSDSVKEMEKARKEHRAALLWLKKESGKLNNPDNSEQLANFRVAQVRVKETRERFERLKVDMAEKIEMVVVSRCNMLSKSLPTYQNGLLMFFEESSKELHTVLLEIKAHHHPQYKRSADILEEQNLLEDQKVYEGLEGNSELPPAPPESQPTSKESEPDLLLDLDIMPDMDSQPQRTEPTETPTSDGQDGGKSVSEHQSTDPDDPFLSLISWGDSVDNKGRSPPKETSGAMESYQEVNSLDELKKLLKMDPVLMQSQSDAPSEKQDESANEGTNWDDFSAFLSGGKEKESTTSISDWQGELQSLMGGTATTKPEEDPLADFLGELPTTSDTQETRTEGNSGDDLLLSETTQNLSLSNQTGPNPPVNLLDVNSSYPQFTNLPMATGGPPMLPSFVPPVQASGDPVQPGGPLQHTGSVQPMQPGGPTQPGGPVQPGATMIPGGPLQPGGPVLVPP
jgi:hypothetical protein